MSRIRKRIKEFHPSIGSEFQAENARFKVIIKKVDKFSNSQRAVAEIWVKRKPPQLIGYADYDRYGTCVKIIDTKLIAFSEDDPDEILVRSLFMDNNLAYLKLSNYNALDGIVTNFDSATQIMGEI